MVNFELFSLISLWFAYEASFDKKLENAKITISRGPYVGRKKSNLSSEKSQREIWVRITHLLNWSSKLYFLVFFMRVPKSRFWLPKGHTHKIGQFQNFHFYGVLRLLGYFWVPNSDFGANFSLEKCFWEIFEKVDFWPFFPWQSLDKVQNLNNCSARAQKSSKIRSPQKFFKNTFLG